jgi:hypothetical protein
MTVVSKSIRMDSDLWQQARAKALAEGMTMQDLVAKLLTEYLKKKGG